MRRAAIRLVLWGAVAALPLRGAEVPTSRLVADSFRGLELRSIGPALMSGRVVDVVKDPSDRSVWYVAAASGGVWKTVNNGTTWTPIFDDQGVYSIGALAIDPTNPQLLWVGTGENNSQRSVGWGDGVYKSLDGGETFTRVGLERSEHIGKIVLDPRDSRVVWVAAQGPLWAPGGDRGLYKSVDGGATWTQVLAISEDTGVSDVVLDPRDPDVVYAASYQRRRHQCCLVAGGPEAAIHKSEDGGGTWRRLDRGLPESDRGRIGLAISPQDPDVLYATVPAAHGEGGFFRSANRGESWQKTSDYLPVDPQYYQEIFPDPHRFDRVYVVDVWAHVSDDGGRTFRPLDSEHRHVDNHHVLFDPDDPEYLLVGGDGGIYESWDRGDTWRFVANLPITQFYRVGLDDAEPFYNVYGGTQDNDTQGGPSRTPNIHGIRNSDWFVTVGGDGYQTRVEPGNPEILYSLWQYGGLVRHDRGSGEIVDIQPQPEPDDEPFKWHWDSPLMISPHAPTRLYFAGQRLFRSDDRGDSWRPVSPDLTRRVDRNRLEIMGRVWSVDAVWKNVFTSFYGQIVALDESPLVEGLLYAGTDDGLVQVSEDGGGEWRRQASFPGVPEGTYVSDLTASSHDPDLVYATFNNHKSGDFTPYVLASADRGRTWRSIAGGLPAGHVTWSLVEDHVDPGLLFLGTEFGLFFSPDAGDRWVQLRGNVPVIPFRDLEIQRRESDLVAATFGRGFYILDDYSPLRGLAEAALETEAALFPVGDAWMYIPSRPLGWGEKAVQGDAFFTAPNPPFGAVFTYWLRDGYVTRAATRREREEELAERGESVPYPSWEELRAEEREEPPVVLLTVSDAVGRTVRVLEGPAQAGFHRVAWDLRFAPRDPLVGEGGEDDPWANEPSGPLAAPGLYTVRLAVQREGATVELAGPREFTATPLGLGRLEAADRAALAAFQLQVGELQRAVMGAAELVGERLRQLALARQALRRVAAAHAQELDNAARQLELRLLDVEVALYGDRTVAKRSEPTLPGLVERVERVVGVFWSSAPPTATHRRGLEIAGEEFAGLRSGLAEIDREIVALYDKIEAAGAPWTPGRELPRPSARQPSDDTPREDP